MHYAKQLHLLLKDNLGLCHGSILCCPYRDNEFAHVRGSFTNGGGMLFWAYHFHLPQDNSICTNLSPRGSFVSYGKHTVGTVYPSVSDNKEKGVTYKKGLPSESHGCRNGFAALHSTAEERIKDKVNKAFLLLARSWEDKHTHTVRWYGASKSIVIES